MLNPGKIDEWIHEVEERPSSAALIIRYIANRLSELAAREEELSAQNIELLSGRKVEEYENRIAMLEYQLDLLKRQLGGEIRLPTDVPTPRSIQEKLDILLYNPLGKVFKLELTQGEIKSNPAIAHISSELAPGGMQPSILATSSQEELLFVFDSGRTVTHPASHLPPSGGEQLAWEQAFLEEPHVKEELAAIQPIAKMSLFDLCIQASRRGFVKAMKTSFFTSHLSSGFIGSGVKQRLDKTCGLTFAMKNDLFVMVSQEGFIFSQPAERLPTAIEEVIRLGISDHIVSSFVMGQKASILFITHNGKAVQRDAGWIEESGSFKSQGQSLLSRGRREAGTRIIGAAAVDEADWGAFIHGDGKISLRQLGELMAAGSVQPGQPAGDVVSFCTFQESEVKP